MKKEDRIARILVAVQSNFKTFGGVRAAAHDGNPFAAAMLGKPAVFALGVEVEEVVRFVLDHAHGPVDLR